MTMCKIRKALRATLDGAGNPKVVELAASVKDKLTQALARLV